jgi:hypothetical protein
MVCNSGFTVVISVSVEFITFLSRENLEMVVTRRSTSVGFCFAKIAPAKIRQARPVIAGEQNLASN